MFWKTLKGDRIAIKDMSDTHILNSIKMLERKKRTYLPTYRWLVNEIKRRRLEPFETSMKDLLNEDN